VAETKQMVPSGENHTFGTLFRWRPSTLCGHSAPAAGMALLAPKPPAIRGSQTKCRVGVEKRHSAAEVVSPSLRRSGPFPQRVRRWVGDCGLRFYLAIQSASVSHSSRRGRKSSSRFAFPLAATRNRVA